MSANPTAIVNTAEVMALVNGEPASECVTTMTAMTTFICPACDKTHLQLDYQITEIKRISINLRFTEDEIDALVNMLRAPKPLQPETSFYIEK